jgi:RNA polymerase sigma-70 factor (ECF subfamily)
MLVGYVRSRGLPEADTRDVVQEIFVSLLRALPNFRLDHRRGRFRTWLWQVTMNAIAEQARRRRKHDRLAREWQARAAVTSSEGDEADPRWVAAHRRRILDHVLSLVKEKMQPKTWTCFEQHVLRGRPCVDVAAEVGLSANAVCVNGARALAKVRDLCAQYVEELDDAGRLLP